jgi:hypothetical protein
MARSSVSAAAAVAVMLAVSCGSDAPAGPSTPGIVTPPRPSAITINGSVTQFQRGQTAQLTALVTLTNGIVEDRSNTVQWQTSNATVVSVNATGLVTAHGDGEATIRATLEGILGEYGVRVRSANRTPDPASGQRLPLPDIQALLVQFNNERPGLMDDSCPGGVKYRNNPWLDYMIDRLRETDTRWGYNAKPTRTSADNGGLPVIAAGDEIAYNFSADPDEGTTNVYLIDILESHCGTPRLTYRHFTGEEPGRWTSLGRF